MIKITNARAPTSAQQIPGRSLPVIGSNGIAVLVGVGVGSSHDGVFEGVTVTDGGVSRVGGVLVGNGVSVVVSGVLVDGGVVVDDGVTA